MTGRMLRNTQADALLGKSVEHGPDPVVEMATQVRSHHDALSAVETDISDNDLVEAADLLREAAKALRDDLDSFEKRRKKHDDQICKELVARAMVHPSTDPYQVLNLNYELPDEIEHLSTEAHKDLDFFTAKAVADGVEKLFADRAEQKRVERNKARTQSRKDFEKRIAEVWA